MKKAFLLLKNRGEYPVDRSATNGVCGHVPVFDGKILTFRSPVKRPGGGKKPLQGCEAQAAIGEKRSRIWGRTTEKFSPKERRMGPQHSGFGWIGRTSQPQSDFYQKVQTVYRFERTSSTFFAVFSPTFASPPCFQKGKGLLKGLLGPFISCRIKKSVIMGGVEKIHPIIFSITFAGIGNPGF